MGDGTRTLDEEQWKGRRKETWWWKTLQFRRLRGSKTNPLDSGPLRVEFDGHPCPLTLKCPSMGIFP